MPARKATNSKSSASRKKAQPTRVNTWSGRVSRAGSATGYLQIEKPAQHCTVAEAIGRREPEAKNQPLSICHVHVELRNQSRRPRLEQSAPRSAQSSQDRTA